MKGRTTPRLVRCKACGYEFISDCVGRQAWYCAREECTQQRIIERKKRDAEQHRTNRPSRRVIAEYQRIEAIASDLEPTSQEFVRAMRAIKSGTHKKEAYLYLSALALAASRRL